MRCEYDGPDDSKKMTSKHDLLLICDFSNRFSTGHNPEIADSGRKPDTENRLVSQSGHSPSASVPTAIDRRVAEKRTQFLLIHEMFTRGSGKLRLPCAGRHAIVGGVCLSSENRFIRDLRP
jgi:hypothetical protein